MAIGTYIQDPSTGQRAKVDSEGAVVFTERLTPPFGFPTIQIPLSQFITDDGTPTGSNDMRVDGSVTSIDFTINADPNNDRYMSVCTFLIADAGASLDEFGNLPQLANGIDIFWETDIGSFIIENATTNFELIRLGLGEPAFGNSQTAMLLNNIVSQTDAYIPVLDFRVTFGFQHGLRLKNGTNERLVIRINDDLTSLDFFNAKIYGFDRLPDPAERVAINT